MEKAYRYHDTLYESGPRVTLDEFEVVRKTPKGFVIDVYGTEKFVLDGVGKRFAHLTKRDALHSFLKRKERQARIYHHRHQAAETSAKLAAYLLKSKSYLARFEIFGEQDIPLHEPWLTLMENEE